MEKKKKSTAASVFHVILGILAVAAVAFFAIFKVVPYVTELVNKFAARQANDVLDDEEFGSGCENSEEDENSNI